MDAVMGKVLVIDDSLNLKALDLLHSALDADIKVCYLNTVCHNLRGFTGLPLWWSMSKFFEIYDTIYFKYEVKRVKWVTYNEN